MDGISHGGRPAEKGCPKCSAAMEEGFIADHMDSTKMQSEWVTGAPEPSFWTGLKIKGKRRYRVVAYRCTGCGYLESYAEDLVV